MSGHCRLLDASDFGALGQLLNVAYGEATDFYTPEPPPDLTAPGGAVMIGAFCAEGRLISTVRAVAIRRARDLAPHTELWSRLPPLLPSLFLKHAGTTRAYERRGLNSLLRFHLLTSAIQEGFASTCGLMTSQGCRARTLSEVGYAAFGAVNACDGMIARTGLWRLYVLDLTDETLSAMRRLRGLTTDVCRDFPWYGPTPKF